MSKLVVENLYKLFGPHPAQGLKLVKKGRGRDEILEKTGCTVALNDVSLTVHNRELLVVMGLSGSGKSTLLRCLNCLIPPTDGRVLLEGQDITHLPRKDIIALRRKSFGMVFQHFALFPHWTVQKNVAYGLQLSGIPRSEQERKSRESLEIVGLQDWAEHFPSQLSGGMQQRVGLARALALDSDILLMDEAFSALDPLIRRDMQDELLTLQRDMRKTIVFITHDLDEALKLGDRIVILRDGGIVQTGTPESILINPADEYVERFVSSADLSSVLTAESIMKPSEATAILGHDGPRSALRKMRTHAITSLFVVDADLRFKGIISADEAERLVREGVSALETIVRADISHVPPETPANDLIPIMAELPYPLAVVDAKQRLRGVVIRGRLLGALAECKEART